MGAEEQPKSLKDISIITPGQRLRDAILKKGYKFGHFAKLSEVDPSTLSRYMKDSQPMSERYVARAADLLDVSEEYLIGKTNDPSPVRYFSYDAEALQEIVIRQTEKLRKEQQNRFDKTVQFLEAMGVSLVWKARLGTTNYVRDDENLWHPVGFLEELRNPVLWTQKDFIASLKHFKGMKEVWVEMSYRGHKKEMEYNLFLLWMKSLTTSIELRMQDTFEFYNDISMAVQETEISKALKNQE